tara:strand:- start:2219 stop:2410 length:192 start_codon:yes stop_codon:yes gene_type:complete
MKKLVRKMFRIKAKQVKKTPKNVNVGVKTLQDIKKWESQKNDLILRSSFNRALYYKYLETIKS